MALVMAVGLALAWSSSAWASITIPGADGTDGALHITADTVIDLSQAVTGVWNQNNTANAGKGVYDPEKWAVVFKYTQVTVDAGATLTFNNHPSRAPVVWLVSGDVMINGTVSLDGRDWVKAPQLAEPGPGGGRGGTGQFSAGVDSGAGFGVGGGRRDSTHGYGGSYRSQGSGGPLPYGNPSLIPLIGGSGGGGLQGDWGWSGGAGGGAILIACANDVAIEGQIRANGGAGNYESIWRVASGSGSGGGIRLISESLSGAGAITAVGGEIGFFGGTGRIRVECVDKSFASDPVPDPSVVDLSAGATALLWPPEGSPEVRVVSIGGEAAPADPRAAFGTFGADVALPQMNAVEVLIETTNVEPESEVTVRITPRDTFDMQEVTAARIDPPVSAVPLVYHWTASVPTELGYSAIQVKVVRP
jgi:hypothetical protein